MFTTHQPEAPLLFLFLFLFLGAGDTHAHWLLVLLARSLRANAMKIKSVPSTPDFQRNHNNTCSPLLPAAPGVCARRALGNHRRRL